MEYWEAWHKMFKEAWQDEESKEFATILGFCDFKGKKILDIGAGIGRSTIRFARLASEIYALDKNEDLLGELKENARESSVLDKIKIVVGDAQELDFPDGSFDIVHCVWTLQSVDNLEAAIKEMVRVTRPGGVIIIALSSGEGDETKMKSFYEPNDIKIREGRIDTVKKLLEESDCRVVEKRHLLDYFFPPDIEETYEILHAITLGRTQLSKDVVEKIKNYLKEKLQEDKIYLTQGASYICGYKK